MFTPRFSRLPAHRPAGPAHTFHGLFLAELGGALLLGEILDLLESPRLLPSQVAGEGGHGREAEEVEDRDLLAQGFLQLLVSTDHQQRVPAEVEEVVVQTDPVDAQQLAEDTRNGPFEASLRLRPAARLGP